MQTSLLETSPSSQCITSVQRWVDTWTMSADVGPVCIQHCALVRVTWACVLHKCLQVRVVVNRVVESAVPFDISCRNPFRITDGDTANWHRMYVKRCCNESPVYNTLPPTPMQRSTSIMLRGWTLSDNQVSTPSPRQIVIPMDAIPYRSIDAVHSTIQTKTLAVYYHYVISYVVDGWLIDQNNFQKRFFIALL